MKKPAFLILIALFTVFVSSCGFGETNDKNDSGKYASETRNDFGFREIKAGNAVILIVSVGQEYGIIVEGEASLLKDVKTEVTGETLVITSRGKISPTNKVRLKISMPELLNLELWGASEATVTNAKSNSLKIQVGGTSTLKIDGETKTLSASAGGDSLLDAENLKAENATVKAAGSSEILIFVSNELDAEALGGSTIFYAGEPKNLKQNIAGTGEIRKK